MAQKTGTLSVLVNSVSRFKYIADRKELVDQAIRQLESEGKIVKNIIDGPIQPLGPLGNVFSTVDILWEIRDDSERSSVNTASSIRVNEKNLDASLLRASMFLEDEDWNTARAYYNAVLDIDPTCAAAYVGLYLSDKHISSEDEFGSWLSQYKVDNEDKNIKKAIRFGYDKHDLKKYSDDYIAVQAKKAETARKDQILKRAETIIAKPEATIINLKKAVEELKAIPGWKNAEGLTYDCQKRIAEIEAFEEAAQKEKERQAAENRIVAEAAKKRLKKTLSIVAPILGACIIAVVLLVTVIIPSRKYSKAVQLYENGEYEEAITIFTSLGNYKDSELQIEQCKESKTELQYNNAINLVKDEKYEEALLEFEELGNYKDSPERKKEIEKIILYYDALSLRKEGKLYEAAVALNSIDYNDSKELSRYIWSEITKRSTIACGYGHTIALKNDGTVVAVGLNNEGQCDVSGWNEIVAIAATSSYTVGLRSDGTVVAVGLNNEGQCNVSDWKDIVNIYARGTLTIGLKADGTVVKTGKGSQGNDSISGWHNIIDVSIGVRNTIGLRNDGTVLVVGSNGSNQVSMDGRGAFIGIYAGPTTSYGITKDNTVRFFGHALHNGLPGWRDIKKLFGNTLSLYGLREDGTIVSSIGSLSPEWERKDSLSSWNEIVDVAVNSNHAVGLKSDGTLISVGENEYGECNVSEWSGIKIPED